MIEVGRLALREDGEYWKAYWAPRQNGMEGAILIGMIRVTLANGPIREGFMELMKAAFDAAVVDAIGRTPAWSKPRPVLKHSQD